MIDVTFSGLPFRGYPDYLVHHMSTDTLGEEIIVRATRWSWEESRAGRHESTAVEFVIWKC